VTDYEYELRDGDAVIATGRLQLDEPPAPGETLRLGSQCLLVDEVLRASGMPRLILERTR
jgi:hypothetical protein